MHGSCCPGSFSRGGHVTDVLRNQCSHTDYERIDTLARQFADMWPVRIHSGDAACDVCRLIEILRTRNETLTIMGDSMKMQAFDGFMCELKRRNYLVDKEETLRDDKQKGNGWGNVKTNSTVTVRSPSWSKYQAVHIRMFFIYSVPFAIQEEHDEINQLGGVLWFNFGLHSHNFPRFKTNMQVFLSSLRHNATFSLILYRETSAQHFDVPGGMYSKQHHRSSNCSALEWTAEVGKRDRAVTKAAQDAGYQIVSPTGASLFADKLVVLPYHNFTAQLHDDHPLDGGAGECTHYCSSPRLWMPL